MFRSHRFLIISGVTSLLVVVALLFLYRGLTISSLIEQEERASTNLAFVLSNVVLADYQNFLEQTESISNDELSGSTNILALDKLVRSSIVGTNINKVLIINKDGLVLYSSNPDQIGMSKFDNTGFQSAITGKAFSQFSFRNRFNGAHSIYADRNIVATYIPMMRLNSVDIFGVFEIYSDVTDLVNTLNRNQMQISASVVGSMLVIYCILFVVARKADKLFREQQEERIAHEADIRYQAYHDVLTGLPNRTCFLERLDEAIGCAKRENNSVGIMFVGVDRFKLVNDSLGHHAGDELLRIAGKRLQRVIRDCDNLFRLGGDEFAVLPELMVSEDGLAHLAQRIINTMNAPIDIDNQSMMVTVSIGISLYPKDDIDAEKLVKNSDSAMYMAKLNGRNQYSFYTPEMNARAHERLAYESALQQALAKNEFVLHYQPRVNTVDASIVGVEALLRWRRKDGELVFPNDFIHILEDRDLIVDVGEWVMRTAMTQVKTWVAQGYNAVRVSVNVSSRQFRNENFVSLVKDVINEAGIGPEYLELELTESLLVDNTERAIGIMHELRDLGVKLSIDDFGTGYSSLSYLKRLPIDYLKIDRSFITDVTKDKKDAAIVNTITTLASELKIGVVAEGVETEEQWKLLETKHCQELQGYYFSRPVEATEITPMLEQKRLVSSQ